MPITQVAGRAHRLSTHLARAHAYAASQFDYVLPSSRIASHPLPDRSASKLLVVPNGEQTPWHRKFSDLPSLLPRDCMLVMNSTRVIPARICMRKKATHGRAELMLLSPVSTTADPAKAMAACADGQVWKGYIGGRRIRVGDVLETKVEKGNQDGDDALWLNATILERDGQSAKVKLSLSNHGTGRNAPSLAVVLELAGKVPLPPYIKRKVETGDRAAYQTVYAREAGSVAAPTAGLHMTEEVLGNIRRRGIDIERVVLHVGAGTFAPLDEETVGGHVMHDERVRIPVQCLRNLARHTDEGRPVVAMGTTSVRVLESMYWLGVRLLTKEKYLDDSPFFVGQWEPYETLDELEGAALPTSHEALRAVVDWSGEKRTHVCGWTQLLIVPGYPFQLTNALVTNFHQPKSTLLMLVSALHGGRPEDLLRIYEQALNRDYRFLSYGDSSLYAPKDFLRVRE